MDIKLRFFVYLAALVCFLFEAVRVYRDSDVPPLTALGLALAVFPTVWDVGEAAW